MTPVISIITPVLNGVRFIEFCINNVIEQSCPDTEHIIVDGCSTDGSVEIIRHYTKKYPHIRWISETDRGQSDAMNKGILAARGNILGFLNVDDYYEDGVLREVTGIITSLPEPSLLVGNCNVWDNDGKLWFVSRPAAISLSNLLLGKYLEAFPMNSSAYFYHKSLHDRIGLYKTDEHYGMDVHFIFQAVQSAKVTYVNKLWGNYRYLEGTKTYDDDRSGGNAPRVKRITEYYLKQQSLYYRIYIAAVKVLGKIMNLIRNYILPRTR